MKFTASVIVGFCFILSTVVCQEIQEDAWNVSNCPSTCTCSMKYSDRFQSKLRTIDCVDKNFVGIPTDLPSDTQSLLLKHNRLRRLTVSASNKRLHDLIELDVSHNLIQAIDIDRYVELFNLKSIDLSFNRLDRLSDYTFRNLFNLVDLNLCDNVITTITDDAFGGLSRLESLRLSGNRLSYVQNTWWSHTKTLYNLNLDRNRFTFVQTDSFKSLPHLLSIDMSRNKIFKLSDQAFHGLDKLETLNMESNLLSVVPRDALRSLKSLKSINFGRNAMFKIRTDDFANMPNLKDVNLSNMQRLRLVERGAFKNLPELLVVEMHDNPYLAYLDRSAFVNTAQVSHLHLHNNNLTVLERETVDSLPTLEAISFYGNPLSCDCNSRWLNKYLTESDESTVAAGDKNDVRISRRPRIEFLEAERIVCDSPIDHRFKLFTTLRPIDMPRTCPPKLLFMFDSNNIRKTGDDITYDCRAVGRPQPRLTWVSPEGEPVTPTAYHPRRTLINGDTLVIRRVKTEDAGLYTCMAENEVGHAVVQTQLNVTNVQVELAVQSVTPSEATLTWTGPDRQSNVFQLLFRALDTPNSRHRYAATVTPIMKSYTLRQLQPSTPYEVCVAFEDDDNVLVHISCVKLATKNNHLAQQAALERTGNAAVGAGLGIVACVMIVLCLLAVGLKRKQDEPSSAMSRVTTTVVAARRLDNNGLSSSTYSLPFFDDENNFSNLYAPLITGHGDKLSSSSSTLSINSCCNNRQLVLV